MIRLIEEKTDIPRYRIGSLNPLEINNELLDILEHSQKFCPHFHLSLQSACDKTLKSMNRFYTVEKYMEQIDDINRRFNNPFIGCDIITGFVGESEQDFEITVKNLKESGLSKIHTFPYSVRKGTFAEKMSGHLSDKVKQERAPAIATTPPKLPVQKFEEFARKNIGTVQEVLIEKRPDKRTGMLKGVSGNYLNVRFDSENSESGMKFNTLVKAEILRFDGSYFYGRKI